MNKEDWKINSKKYKNSFWEYITAKSNKIGEMDTHTKSQISQLLNTPQNQCGQKLDSALEKINKHLNINNASKLLNKIFPK